MSLSRCIFKMVSGEGLQWRILSSRGWLSIWNTTIWRTEQFWSPNHRATARVKLPQIIVHLLMKLSSRRIEGKPICAAHQMVSPIPKSKYSWNFGPTRMNIFYGVFRQNKQDLFWLATNFVKSRNLQLEIRATMLWLANNFQETK